MSNQTIYGQHASDWDHTRLKWSLASLQSGARETGGGNLYDDGVFSIGGEHIGWTGELRTEPDRYISEEFYRKMNSGKVSTGDVLLVKDGATIGKLALIRSVPLGRAAINEHVFILRTNQSTDPAFLFYFLQSAYGQQQIQLYVKGSAQPGLNSQFINYIHWEVPAQESQKHIIDFLDRETARIDALIEKKQRQIELLQEKRSALINHAVTKGLDPDAKMKDSGIEWLGEIPAHWDLPPLYARYSVELGKMLDAKRFTGKYLLPYLRNIDVQWDRVNVESLPEMDIEPDEYSRFTLADGDLLVCEGGEVGRTAMWSGELPVCAFQKAIHRVRPRSTQDVPRFYYYIMRAAAWSGVFLAYGNPNTIPHLTAEKLRVYRFPFPPQDEQEMIVQHLDFETQRIDALVAKVKTSIDKLREYRTALISAAVTGKIDVRTMPAGRQEEVS